MTTRMDGILRPRSATLLGVVAAAGTGIAVSALLKQVNSGRSEDSGDLLSLGDVVHELKLLETAGLVTAVRASPQLQIRCTPLGHQLSAARGRRDALDDSTNPSISSALSAGVVLLASCATSLPQAPRYEPRPLAEVTAAQRVFDGQLVWAPCGEAADCPGPTPKTRVYNASASTAGDAVPPRPRFEDVRPLAPPSSVASASPPAGADSASRASVAAVIAPVAALTPATPRVLPLETAPTAREPTAPDATTVESVSIFFPSGDGVISPAEHRFGIQAARLALPGHGSTAKIVIVGMTDKTGSSNFNVRLSQLRADRVRLLLSDAGVDLGRMSTRVDTTASTPIPPQAIARATPGGQFAPFRRVDVVITTSPRLPASADSAADPQGARPTAPNHRTQG